jgi:hypothetical protein
MSGEKHLVLVTPLVRDREGERSFVPPAELKATVQYVDCAHSGADALARHAHEAYGLEADAAERLALALDENGILNHLDKIHYSGLPLTELPPVRSEPEFAALWVRGEDARQVANSAERRLRQVLRLIEAKQTQARPSPTDLAAAADVDMLTYVRLSPLSRRNSPPSAWLRRLAAVIRMTPYLDLPGARMGLRIAVR